MGRYFPWPPLEAALSISGFCFVSTRCLWTVDFRKKLPSINHHIVPLRWRWYILFIKYFTVSTCELFVRVQLVILKSRTYHWRSLLLDVGLNVIRFSRRSAYQRAANLPLLLLNQKYSRVRCVIILCCSQNNINENWTFFYI